MGKVLIVAGGDGIGGLMNGFQVAHYVKQAGYEVDVKLSASNEVYYPLYHLFHDQFIMSQLPIEYSQNHRLLHDDVLLTTLTQGYEDFAYICPDLTYKYFNYKKYNILPNTIKGTRLLTHRFNPQRQIYLALNTTTAGYNYKHIHALLLMLSSFLPQYTIYLSVLNKWSNLDVKRMELPNELPKNVVISRDPDFIDQLDLLSQCSACICLDNGLSHIAYHLGQIRILLDPHLVGDLAWKIRWREDMADSVELITSPANIARILFINLSCPETQLLSKREVLDVIGSKNIIDWKQELFLKY